MLGGKMSNNDEEEVEQELEALENEVRGDRQEVPVLPQAPSQALPAGETGAESEEQRQLAQVSQGERQAMLA